MIEIKRFPRLLPALAAGLLLASAGCSNDPTLTNNSGVPSNFVQIDRVGRPGINTIFVTFAKHDANDRDTPSNDAQTLAPQITSFVTSPAGRSSATIAAAANVLSPDVLIADFSQSGSAGYLGVETNGAIGSKFGGRALSDDAMTTNLGIAFGNTLATAGLAPDDGNENDGRNGTPNLVNDHVSAPTNTTSVFPYLAPPH